MFAYFIWQGGAGEEVPCQRQVPQRRWPGRRRELAGVRRAVGGEGEGEGDGDGPARVSPAPLVSVLTLFLFFRKKIEAVFSGS